MTSYNKSKMCLACGKPRGIPPIWKRILQKIGFYPNGLYIYYCTKSIEKCDECNGYNHGGSCYHL